MSEPGSSSEGTSALLSFTVENALSYRDETTLSLEATRLSEKDARRDLALTGRKYPVGVLPAVGLFGANASGKSTILKAMADMRMAVLNSFHKRNSIRNIYQPFALDPQSCNKPSSYAVDLIINNVRWQYGFEINDTQVLKEYAFYFPKGRQALVFRRDGEDLKFGAPLQSSGLRQFSKEHALLLSTAKAAENNNLSPLFKWFNYNLSYIPSQFAGSRLLNPTADLLEDEDKKLRNGILALIRLADLGITGIKNIELKLDPDIADRITKIRRILEGDGDHTKNDEIEGDGDHTKNDEIIGDIGFEHSGNTISVVLEPKYESTGTLTWANLIGRIILALSKGYLLLIDELNSSLHPNLVAVLIDLFQSPISNPRCAQIIFNAHDMTILNRHHSNLGRDQIWFTEKDSKGVTTMYSLAEFRTGKDDIPYISYLKGRYGALPILDLTEISRALDFDQE